MSETVLNDKLRSTIESLCLCELRDIRNTIRVRLARVRPDDRGGDLLYATNDLAWHAAKLAIIERYIKVLAVTATPFHARPDVTAEELIDFTVQRMSGSMVPETLKPVVTGRLLRIVAQAQEAVDAS